ncbi:MAG: DUF4159 domain-containing protein [candidate division Zixibacteria bacterium]|nr:DUF4159 domain-containing protein [candidate division Zixibacteria bacterium]
MEKVYRYTTILIILIGVFLPVESTSLGQVTGDSFTIARLKYGGGGDWYWGRSAIPNMHQFLRENTNVEVSDRDVKIPPEDDRLFNYPFVFLTGHGNIKFTDEQIDALRRYFRAGGFLFANDSYGLDASLRRELKRILPESELVELPFNHEIYHCYYDFPNGVPKIHKHDEKPAQGFGMFLDGRLVAFYAYESDIGDGWEDYEVHHDPPEKREAALKMGTNLIIYTLTQTDYEYEE